MFFCAIIQIGSVSIANHNLREKYVQTMAKKKLSKFTKQITHVDDMMIHNLVTNF
jgi:hypothetical protein